MKAISFSYLCLMAVFYRILLLLVLLFSVAGSKAAGNVPCITCLPEYTDTGAAALKSDHQYLLCGGAMSNISCTSTLHLQPNIQSFRNYPAAGVGLASLNLYSPHTILHPRVEKYGNEQLSYNYPSHHFW